MGILERQAYNEIRPRVEYKMIKKGQELVESILNLVQWMINGLDATLIIKTLSRENLNHKYLKYLTIKFKSNWKG